MGMAFQLRNQVPIYPKTTYAVGFQDLFIFVSGSSSSLGANDVAIISQGIETTNLRELLGDVHSAQVMLRSSIPLKFGLCLLANNQSLTHLCEITTPNVWTVPQAAGLPVFPSGISLTPGQQGYNLIITLAAGANFMNSVNDAWTNVSTGYGAPGQDNFFNNPVSSTQLEIAWVQHQPGPVCSYPIDKPFDVNLHECKRYYQKSWDLPVMPGSQGFPGLCYGIGNGSSTVRSMTRLEREMYIAPTLMLYTQGAVKNSVTLDLPTPVDSALSAPLAPSTKAIGDIVVSRSVPVGTPVYFHYTADTGL